MPIISELPCSLGTGSSGTIEDINSVGGTGPASFFNFPVTVSVNKPSGNGARNGALWVTSTRVHSATKIFITDTKPDASSTTNALYLVVPDLQYIKMDITQATGVWKPVETHIAHGNGLDWLAGDLSDGSKVWMQLPFAYSKIGDIISIETLYYWNGTQWTILSEDGRVLYSGSKSFALTGRGMNIKAVELEYFYTDVYSKLNTAIENQIYGVSGNGQRIWGVTGSAVNRGSYTLFEKNGIRWSIKASSNIIVGGMVGSGSSLETYSNIVTNIDGSMAMQIVSGYAISTTTHKGAMLVTYVYNGTGITRKSFYTIVETTFGSVNVKYQVSANRYCLDADSTLSKVGTIIYTDNTAGADTQNVSVIAHYFSVTDTASPTTLFTYTWTKTRSLAKTCATRVYDDGIYALTNGAYDTARIWSILRYDGVNPPAFDSSGRAVSALKYYLGTGHYYRVNSNIGAFVWYDKGNTTNGGIYAMTVDLTTGKWVRNTPILCTKMQNITGLDASSNVTASEINTNIGATAYYTLGTVSSGSAATLNANSEGIILMSLKGLQLFEAHANITQTGTVVNNAILASKHKTLIASDSSATAYPKEIAPNT